MISYFGGLEGSFFALGALALTSLAAEALEAFVGAAALAPEPVFLGLLAVAFLGLDFPAFGGCSGDVGVAATGVTGAGRWSFSQSTST
jgi:hypothetical protein